MSTNPPLGVSVFGAKGRMGSFACRLLRDSADFELLAAVSSGQDFDEGLHAGALGLDFTVAGLGFEHGKRMLAGGMRPVIGTSGVTPDEIGELDRMARELGLGGRVVPNFSLGAWALEQVGRLLAPRFPQVEIVETHHERKRDAPSGTAKHLARALEAAGTDKVPIHSLRLPGHYAEHALAFGSTGEFLELKHSMSGPEAFGTGILFALELAATDTGMHVGLPWERLAGPPTKGSVGD